MIGLLSLIRESRRVHDERDPSNIVDLKQGVLQRVDVDTPSGNERKDRMAILGALFSCPANIRLHVFVRLFLQARWVAGLADLGLFLAQ